MIISNSQLWQRYQELYYEAPELGLAVDISRTNINDAAFRSIDELLPNAYSQMNSLEKGSVANPDERRMVGHYWLRNSALAPTPDIRSEIEQTIQAIQVFAQHIHAGQISGSKGLFKNYLLIGIGGSALGPQFVARALGYPRTDRITPFFFDNTDPDGMDLVLSRLEGQLGQTLCLVISKSGGTQETRNGLLEAKAAYERAGLQFESHAVAVTGTGSRLYRQATEGNWLKVFPMWDWVGGRTSETSAVGLLPAVLQGIEIDRLLAGARTCDEITRQPVTRNNPAALLAVCWYHLTNGSGTKDMVILPYKDRLELFSRYLQQLVMESLGKERDLHGAIVNQGLTVFGNKGSTDQHAYVQQLREGVQNFFVTFIEVKKERVGSSVEVEPGTTAGDYLLGFLLGTREALYSKGRPSITVTINEVSAFSVGVLIALFERAVGLYASMININAYHQPGVEAGKKAASAVIDLQRRIQEFLSRNRSKRYRCDELAQAVGAEERIEWVFKICEHLAANPGRGIRRHPGGTSFTTAYEFC